MKKWNEDDYEIVKEMYYSGKPYSDIAVAMNVSLDTMKKKIKRYQESGKLDRRNRPYNRRISESEFKRANIINDYLAGMTVPQLAEKHNTTKNYTYVVVEKARKAGLIPEDCINKASHRPLRVHQEKRGIVYSRERINQNKKLSRFAEPTLKNGEPVKCTKTVSSKCVYGSENGSCRFSLCTGKSRSVTVKDFQGCTREACIRYSAISKHNPRRDCIGDFKEPIATQQ